jgi:serine protease Do
MEIREVHQRDAIRPSRRTGRRFVAVASSIVLMLTFVALGRAAVKGAGEPIWSERTVAVAPGNVVQMPAWVELAKALKPAVVNISTKSRGTGAHQRGMDPFEQFFGNNMPKRPMQGLGSGFIINANGYIATNNHVVDDATEVRVKLSDGREFKATVVGKDPKTDVALVKIDASGLPTVPLGDSSQLQVGEPVMAIGNPFGLEQTVTTGIVSATGRVIGEGPYDDFIQTDASINPGNSGGPLINTRGQAIGINTAIFTQSGGSVGIGFAIPISLTKPVISQLASSGHVTRGWLGVSIQSVTPDLAKSFHLPADTGALVGSVVDGSPAMKAGMKAGDVIVEYNGRKVSRADELPRVVAETPVGQDATMTVVRDGKPMKVTARIAQLSETAQKEASGGGEGATLGLAVQPLTPALAKELGIDETRGVVVRGVEDGSSAANAGLRPGDVIVELDHRPVKGVDDLRRNLDSHEKGTPILVLVHRNGGALYLAMSS